MGEKKTATFSMRMEPEKKRRMEDFFEELGINVPCGVKIFVEKCIMEAGLPFEAEEAGEKGRLNSTGEKSTSHKTAQFAARLDPYKKAQIEYTFQELGMTMSEAVNLYFDKCLSEWGIPFRVGYPKPNAETLAAMKEDVSSKTYSSVDEMFRDLDEET